MATNFSANQYENAFGGKRLQNWEIPATFKERPSSFEGYTQPIADNRGHLLDGVRRSQKCPWGGFVGTWDSSNSKPKPQRLDGGKLKYDGGAEVLTVHTPPSSASKKNMEKPLSPVPQPFDEKDMGISKHIEDIKKTEALEVNKLPTPSPPPRTAERTPSPAASKAGVDISVQPE